MLAADFLQTILNKAKNQGLLQSPIRSQACPDFPVVQYGDDTLIIMPACARQLFSLKNILNTFATSTGLKVNFQKSCLVPINVPEEKVEILLRTLDCQRGSLPFTYLGLPLGLTWPKVEDFFPVIQKIDRRLASCAQWLTYAGQLTMVNAVLSALPTFYMCSLMLPAGVIKQIDRARKHCLWRGSDLTATGPALAKWSMVCRPKMHGGLGVIMLTTQNKALLLKNAQVLQPA